MIKIFYEDIDIPYEIDFIFYKKNKIVAEKLINIVANELYSLSSFYPDFYNWYESKVKDGIISGERKILLATRERQIAGIAIVKDTKLEKKLCCLRVSKKFQGSGVGILLFERSFETLGTNKPLLSISNQNIEQFNKIFRYFGFHHENSYQDLYRKNNIELSFNGFLEYEQASVGWSISDTPRHNRKHNIACRSVTQDSTQPTD